MKSRVERGVVRRRHVIPKRVTLHLAMESALCCSMLTLLPTTGSPDRRGRQGGFADKNEV